jgi:hypothetical protein
MTDKKGGRPGLASRKTLLIHNYELFLDRQTRLFATANSKAYCLSLDISEKRELLLLDDLTIFAISGRRLLDLCGLVSSANTVKLEPVVFDSASVSFLHVEAKSIGFETLLNRLLHLSYFQYIDDLNHLKIFAGKKVKNDE